MIKAEEAEEVGAVIGIISGVFVRQRDVYGRGDGVRELPCP